MHLPGSSWDTIVRYMQCWETKHCPAWLQANLGQFCWASSFQSVLGYLLKMCWSTYVTFRGKNKKKKYTHVGGKSCICQQLCFVQSCSDSVRNSLIYMFSCINMQAMENRFFRKGKPPNMNAVALKASHMGRNDNHYDHSHLVLFTVRTSTPETHVGLLKFLHASDLAAYELSL